MVAALGLVVIPIVKNELRCIGWPRIRQTARERVAACAVVDRALRIERFAQRETCVDIGLVEIPY